MHLGGLRTALFNYLISRKTGGQFLLRIEDTDQARTVPGAADGIASALQWAKIEPTSGEPVLVQSARLSVYRQHIDQLISDRKAYRCFCSRERLEGLKSEHSEYMGYDKLCRSLPEAYQPTDRPHVVRLRVPSGQRISFRDRVFGATTVESAAIDDAILIKSDGFPTYHFANVIDDHASSINLVMRGQEWLPSTPLHVLLYDMLGRKRPEFAHLPLLIRPDGSKLSKRHGDAFVDHYRQLGYLPEALANFVAFLGWSPSGTGSDVLSMDDLVERFSLDALNKGESRVDASRLNWLNRRHLGLLSGSNRARLVTELCTNIHEEHPHLFERCFDDRVRTEEYLASVVALIKDRIHTLHDIGTLCPYFFIRPTSVSFADAELASRVTQRFEQCLLDGLSWSHAVELAKQSFPTVQASVVMSILRLAITGVQVGASLVETMALLGRPEVLARLNYCRHKQHN